MAWRGVHISKPARLKLRDHQLVVLQDDGEVALALEDLAWLILDTPQITITGALLSALVQSNVAMIVPDAKRHPAGMLLGFHQHHAQAHIGHLQIGISQPLKKRLWQMLVVAKIQNQAALLQQLQRPQASTLNSMARRVTSGDPENLEAQAARVYWPSLFSNFIRADQADRRNALLDYGYAVVRAALARACVASGLLPTFGVHHASKTNAFNLVDDLIEPLRPFVDQLVAERAPLGASETLDVEDRRQMATILGRPASLGHDQMTLLATTELVAASLVRAIESSSAALLCTPALAKSSG